MNFDELFNSTPTRPIKYNERELVRMEKFNLLNNLTKCVIHFIEVNSLWRQGVILKTKGDFLVNNLNYPNQIVLWKDTSPADVDFIIKSRNKELIIFNVWDVGNGTMHFWHNGGAMEVKKENNLRIFYCNDGFPDDDFNDLIFSIEFLGSPLRVLK